jgi:tetratricopeptide (TPR) repeat protein
VGGDGGALAGAGQKTGPVGPGYVITAEQRKFWSFQPVHKPAIPPVKDKAWVKTPIDNFVLARLEKEGLRPVQAADKNVLLRRVYLDLVGLPPTREQVSAFLVDRSPKALAKVVDQLLASPHYGKRWGRHWLDVARYTDDTSESILTVSTSPVSLPLRTYRKLTPTHCLRGAVSPHSRCMTFHLSALLFLASSSVAPAGESLAQSLNNMGAHYHEMGQYKDAEKLYRQSLEAWKDVPGDHAASIAKLHGNLGALCRATGRYAEAEKEYAESLRLAELPLTLSNAAELYRSEGKYEEAEQYARKALAAPADNDRQHADRLNALGAVRRSQGQFDEALQLFQEEQQLIEKSLGVDDPLMANPLGNIAGIYIAQGRYAEAEPLAQRALALLEKGHGPEHPRVAAGLNNLAQVYRLERRFAEAEPLYRRALSIWEKAIGPEHPDYARGLVNLAGFYEETGRESAAASLYVRALPVLEKNLGPDQPETMKVRDALAKAYYAQGRRSEAQRLYRNSFTPGPPAEAKP